MSTMNAPENPRYTQGEMMNHPGETSQERYLRQIRNATVTIAIIVVLGALLTLIGMILGVAELHSIYNLFQTGINANSGD